MRRARRLVQLFVVILLFILLTSTHALADENSPYSIWDDTVQPTGYYPNPNPIEVGLKFRSNIDGRVDGIRFYKHVLNTGSHVGHLWKNDGTLLAEATFTNESASGWQSVLFSNPVPVNASTTYIVSYFTPRYFSLTQNYFSSSGFDNLNLHALANNEDGPNGVYREYGGFPIQAYSASNYWVDIIFNELPPSPDTTPPTVVSVSPQEGTVANIDANITAQFNEALLPDSINGSTFELRDTNSNLVTGTISYEGGTFTAALDPIGSITYSAIYTATVKGGVDGVKDLAGNSLVNDYTWSFSTGEAPPLTYSLWDDSVQPAGYYPNSSPIEVGLKFRSSIDGYVDGVRFYKHTLNTGSHVGHLWSGDGTLLAEAAFANETAAGWQSVLFSSPVPISANTMYIVSYFTPRYFSLTPDFFATSGFDNHNLHAFGNGEDGPNGVYQNNGGFPTQTYRSSNYWVDIIFDELPPVPDTTPPTVMSVHPQEGTTASRGSNISAYFNEAMLPNTINISTFELRDVTNNVVSATISYDSVTHIASLDPIAVLSYSTTFTATIRGGSAGVKDLAGNPLVFDYIWSFSTGDSPIQAPGGPVVIITTASNPFTNYYVEIVRNEGFNEYSVIDVVQIDEAILDSYDVAILGETLLTNEQTTALTNWVNGGGNLIAMRPDPQLAGLLGLQYLSQTISDGYLQVDTSHAPGTGIVSDSMQFHGPADYYSLNGASELAFLLTDATNSSGYPALTINYVGSNGGKAAAFTYDLARSIVYTRQGNPAWAGQHRNPWQPHYVALDIFYPDWIDFGRISIPQADEQQRLLANLILYMNQENKPLPRFWYFPHGEKAVVVLSGDDHTGLDGAIYSGSTMQFFENQLARSPEDCSVDNWECVRSSSYMYVENPMTDQEAAYYTGLGFEIGVHVNSALSNGSWCASWSTSSLITEYQQQLDAFQNKYTSIPSQTSERSHCYAWYKYTDQPIVEYNHGVRMDTNIAYWPSQWVQNIPGFMFGSGMPMRFADSNGNIIDVYNAGTIISDDNADGQIMPYTIDTMLDRALGTEGFFGAFTVNTHSDNYYPNISYSYSDQIITSAQARDVPLVSGRQMVNWLDGRNDSAFSSISWDGSTLAFEIVTGSNANGLQGMVPFISRGGEISEISHSGFPISYTVQMIKGIDYAFFNALDGTYVVEYSPPTPTPPEVVSVNPQADSTASINTLVTAEFDEALLPTSINSSTFELRDNASNVISATISYDPGSFLATLQPVSQLSYSMSYTAMIKGGIDGVKNLAGNPLTNDYIWSFNTEAQVPPTVVSVTPMDGAVAAVSSNVTVRFSEAMLPTSINTETFELHDVDGNSVSGTISYDGSTFTAALDPVDPLTYSATYTATIKGGSTGVKDQTAYPLVSDYSWSFSTEDPPPSTYSLWDDSVQPTGYYPNPSPIEVGLKVQTTTDGYIAGVRFYKHSLNTGSHVGHLWANDGTMLAEATFTNETSSGWQSVLFSNPVPVTANTTYIVSYITPRYISLTQDYFSSSGYDNLSLHALANGEDGPNGVYQNNGGFPTQTYRATNYWVDVIFDELDPLPDTTPPNVASVSPEEGTVAGIGSKITVQFNEAMLLNTINTDTFELRDVVGNSVSGTISYDGSTFTATLDPLNPLTYSTAYTATVKGGSSGVKDLAAHPLVNDYTWSFTTEDPPPPTFSLWDDSVQPEGYYQNPNPIELGLKFRSNIDGYVHGVRFYKHILNTGSHVGHLWASDGTMLAEATFTNETSSGWQSVIFSNPVPITANTTYIVSYLTPQYFSLTRNFFRSSGVDNLQLHALANNEDGPNGIFQNFGGFPTQTYRASNYWVDVIFGNN